MDQNHVRELLEEWGRWVSFEPAVNLGYPSQSAGAWMITDKSKEVLTREQGLCRVVERNGRRVRERITYMAPPANPKQTRSKSPEPDGEEWPESARLVDDLVRRLPYDTRQCLAAKYVRRYGRHRASRELEVPVATYRAMLDRAEAMIAGMLLTSVA